MNRRDFNVALAAMSALSMAQMANAQGLRREDGPSYAMLIHPKMVLQDLVGPMTVFNLTMGMNHLVWKDMTPVPSELGISVTPTHTFDTCPREVDVLFVPGGLAGTIDMMQDQEVLAFLQDMAPSARFVTSVCTGTLVLGAAGLLDGKRATSHWYTRDILSVFGAIPVEDRVVQDGNLITGGGVTAGIDFGFTIAAALRGEERANRVMLTLEYDPARHSLADHPPAPIPKTCRRSLVAGVMRWPMRVLWQRLRRHGCKTSSGGSRGHLIAPTGPLEQSDCQRSSHGAAHSSGGGRQIKWALCEVADYTGLTA